MVITSKSEIRKRIRIDRQNLSEKFARKSSEKITQSSLNLVPWDKTKSVHCYVPVWTDLEVDSWYIFKHIWENHPEIETIVPRLNSAGLYDNVLVNSKTKWKSQGVRIPEPLSGKVLDNDSTFDIVIVPMLGFDKSGHRLGHGLGWYDRFLLTQPKALTIGLSYEIGNVIPRLPVEPHDVKLKYIVTENTVRKF